MLTVSVSVNPFFSFNSGDYLSFLFISSALSICVLLGYIFLIKFWSWNLTVIALKKLIMQFLQQSCLWNSQSAFLTEIILPYLFYICEIVCLPLFSFLCLWLSISFISIDIHPNSYFLLYWSGENLPYFVSTAGNALSSKPTCPPRNLSALQD